MAPISLSAAAPQKKEKILIIIGDGAFGEQLAAAVRDAGYEVILVKNGIEGMKAVYDNMPHLVILDISVPGSDSYDILTEKGNEPMLARIPLFLMSVQGIPINMKRVPHNSVTEFIVAMHANIPDIISRINRHFGHEIKGASPEGANTGKKVFWVEDDKLIGNILSKKFISSGFQLFHAKNGDEAMAELKNVIPDIIVLDLMLPGMSGFDILQMVRQDGRLKNVPVMILSNLSKPSDIEKAKIMGVQKFLVKAAVSLDQIVAEVRAMAK
ncbi:MAG: response regulator [Patescibacteria group bacterium]|nr:response regulator [Patescibacteria group bacterium]